MESIEILKTVLLLLQEGEVVFTLIASLLGFGGVVKSLYSAIKSKKELVTIIDHSKLANKDFIELAKKEGYRLGEKELKKLIG